MARTFPRAQARVNATGPVAPYHAAIRTPRVRPVTLGPGVASRASLPHLAERHGLPTAWWQNGRVSHARRLRSRHLPRHQSRSPNGCRLARASRSRSPIRARAPRWKSSAMSCAKSPARPCARRPADRATARVEVRWSQAQPPIRHDRQTGPPHARARRRRRSSPARRDGALRVERLGRVVRERRLRRPRSARAHQARCGDRRARCRRSAHRADHG